MQNIWLCFSSLLVEYYRVWSTVDNPKFAGFLNPKPMKVTVYNYNSGPLVITLFIDK